MINNVAGPGTTTMSGLDGTAVGPGGKLGKNEFLKLLVTQLRYQDPLSPLKGEEMAAQLAQFSSLEQLVNIGDALATQQAQGNELLMAVTNSVAITTMGKEVTAVSDQVFVNADGEGKVSATVAGSGQGVLTITDANGKVLGTRSLGYVSAGMHEFELGTAAAGLEEGGYLFRIDVTGADGKPVEVETYTTARIDGITYGAQGALLTAGPLRIHPGAIIKITS